MSSLPNCCTPEQVKESEKYFADLGGNLTWTEKGSAWYDDSIRECEHGNLYLILITGGFEDGSEDEVDCSLATVDDLRKAYKRQEGHLQHTIKQMNGERLINTLCQGCNKSFKGFIWEDCRCGKPISISMKVYKSWFYKTINILRTLKRKNPQLVDSLGTHVIDTLKIYLDDFIEAPLTEINFEVLTKRVTSEEFPEVVVNLPYGIKMAFDCHDQLFSIWMYSHKAQQEGYKNEIRWIPPTAVDMKFYDNFWKFTQDFKEYLKGLDNG